MQTTKWCLLVLLCGSLWACQGESSNNNTTEPTDTTTTEEEVTEVQTTDIEQPAADLATLDGFLAAFKAAFEAKDVAALKSMSTLEDANFYNDALLNTYGGAAQKLEVTDVEESLEMEGAMQFQLEDLPEDESGEGEGSAILFYIQKIEGQFKVVQTMGIG